MKLSVLLFLSFVFLSFNLSAQDAWKTQLGAGLTITNYPNYIRSQGIPTTSFFLEVTENWNRKHDQKLSLTKEFGLSLKYSSLSRESKGGGGGTHYSGAFYSASCIFSLLPQFRVNERSIIQFGPFVEELLVGYENLQKDWWVSDINGYGIDEGTSKSTGFSRKYFNKPYWGLTFKFFETGMESQFNGGLSISYLLTEKSSSNFNTKGVMRVAFVIEF